MEIEEVIQCSTIPQPTVSQNCSQSWKFFLTACHWQMLACSYKCASPKSKLLIFVEYCVCATIQSPGETLTAHGLLSTNAQAGFVEPSKGKTRWQHFPRVAFVWAGQKLFIYCIKSVCQGSIQKTLSIPITQSKSIRLVLTATNAFHNHAWCHGRATHSQITLRWLS